MTEGKEDGTSLGEMDGIAVIVGDSEIEGAEEDSGTISFLVR